MADAARWSEDAAESPHERPLDAVVFDAGGTLVRLDFEWMAAELARRGHATSAHALRRAEVAGRRRYDESRGSSTAGPLGARGDIRAYFGGTLEAAGVPPALVPAMVDRFLRRERTDGLWVRMMEGARAALDAIGVMGLRRAVVSNSDGRAEWHLRHTGMLEGIEFVVDSKLVGIEKPDPEVFHIALRRLGVPPHRALYVGDIRSVDEAGARAAGMHFVLIDPLGDYAAPGTQAIREIRQLPDWIAARSRERFFTGRSPC
jgi:putative hydrolase of the HAD superfamily